MQFLDWLDRHFTSNSHFYFYADELGSPLDYYPHGLTDDGLPMGTSDVPIGRSTEPLGTALISLFHRHARTHPKHRHGPTSVGHYFFACGRGI